MQQEDNNDVIQSIKQEQEYLMYIEDHCSELRDLINKLYDTKIYIVKNNPTGVYRDKIR